VSYDIAFGGVDRSSEDPKKHRWYLLNHAGVGFHADTSPKALNDRPLPNTEVVNQPVSQPGGGYTPMAFGPVGRAWQPRVKWAGTYDKQWLDNKAPFLPDDFDDRYFQAAPADQQTDYLRGGEEVVLTHLTPGGRLAFRMPDFTLPVAIVHKDGSRRDGSPVVDTVTFEPDLKRFTVVWRASLPLRRNLFEVRQVEVGKGR